MRKGAPSSDAHDGDPDGRAREPMRTEALSCYVAPEILQIWQSAIGPALLPLHDRAVGEFGLFGEKNLLVFGPRSSERAFIGEMAAVRAARAGTKVIYLVAHPEIATARCEEFRERYGPVGLDVVVTSRQQCGADRQMLDGDFEIAVATFEKLQALFASRPDLLADVGLVVADGLDLLTDPRHGPALEVLLTMVLTAGRRTRLVALSAAMGPTKLLREWLSARLLIDPRRSEEVRVGVLVNGEFRYRENNSGAVGVEPFPTIPSKNRHHLMLAAAQELIRRGESVIVLLPDCTTALRFALRLAERLPPSPVTTLCGALDAMDQTGMLGYLRRTFDRSVAVHSHEMTRAERDMSERAFRGRQANALVASSSLPLPADLRADNVILDHRKSSIHGLAENPFPDDLSTSAHDNLSSHAGGPQLKNPFGRCMLVTPSPGQAEHFFARYASGRIGNVVPPLKDELHADAVLNMVASRRACTRRDLESLFLATYTGRTHWTGKAGAEEAINVANSALDVCLRGGLVRVDPAGRLIISKLGRLAAARSMSVLTTLAFVDWARQRDGVSPAALEVLTLLGQTVDGAKVFVPYTAREERESDYEGEFLARLHALGLAELAIFAPYTRSRMTLEDDQARTVKKTLVLADWIDELPIANIEHRYDLRAGSLERISEEYAWLCEGLAAVCARCQWPPASTRAIEVLSERLRFGVKEDALGVMGLENPHLRRGLVPSLRSAGLLALEALARADPQVVSGIVGGGSAAESVHQQLEDERLFPRHKPWETVVDDVSEEHPLTDPARPPEQAAESVSEYGPRSKNGGVPAAEVGAREAAVSVGSDAPDAVIDWPSRRITLCGCPIPPRPPGNLSAVQFIVFTIIALKAGTVVSTAELVTAMERLDRVARKPVAPEPREIRYRILQVLRKAVEGKVPEEKLESLIETVSGVGLRFNGTAQVLGLPRGIAL